MSFLEEPEPPPPHPLNVEGDFYVQFGCCLLCEVPKLRAPDLFQYGVGDLVGCYVVKQPKTPGEYDRMFAVFDEQEMDCIRYRGTNPVVKKRLRAEVQEEPPR